MIRCLVGLGLIFFVVPLHVEAQRPIVARTDSLDIMLGQMICVGLGNKQSLSWQSSVLKDVAAGRAGSVILFEYNLAKRNTAPALKKLIKTLQNAAPTPLFIAIDEEGGRVNRLRPSYGFSPTRSAAALAKLGLDSTRAQAKRTARQLKGVGINLNFAPVVDLAIEKENPVIVKMERSYGASPRQVVSYARVVIKEHLKAGVIPVLKHFPGHGSSTKDTHLGTVDVSATWQQKELIPYQQLMATRHAPALMTAHVVNAQLDAKRLPATLSKPVLQNLLRKKMGYQGVVFSDDLHMGAITTHFTLEDVLVDAVDAGIDILLFSYNGTPAKTPSPSRVHALLKGLVIDRKIPYWRIKQSYRRIQALKASIGLLPR